MYYVCLCVNYMEREREKVSLVSTYLLGLMIECLITNWTTAGTEIHDHVCEECVCLCILVHVHVCNNLS